MKSLYGEESRFRQWLRLRRRSVTTQVVLIITVIVLPINILAIYYTRQAQQAVLKQGQESVLHAVELHMRGMDERIYSADNFMMRDVDKNLYCLSLRSHREGAEFMKDANLYWQTLKERASGYMEADAYFFYMESEDYGNVATNSEYQTSRAALNQYICQADTLPYNKSWYIETIGGEKWLVHIFENKGFYYGAFLNVGSIEAAIKKDLLFEQVTVQLADNNAERKHADACAGHQFPQGIDDNNQIQNTVPAVKSSRMNIWASVDLSREEILNQVPFGYQLALAVAFIYLLLIPVLVLVIRRTLIRPLQRVNQAMGQLESGNSEYRIVTPGESVETEELNLGFNSMADHLKELKIEVYENKLEKMDIEATNLQLQVNPHFILNSLNIVFSLAKSGNLDHIKILTKHLANYLRFSLWHTSGTVSILDELKCVRNYMDIQRYRFPHKFTYIENIDQTLEHEQIPALLILNFIENIIKYALNMEMEIEIIVIIRREGDDIMMSICDTGNGMEAHVLESIREGEAFTDERGKHIGIWNCRRRLNMMYGGRAYFHITSQVREGTQVFIKIPIAPKEEAR